MKLQNIILPRKANGQVIMVVDKPFKDDSVLAASFSGDTGRIIEDGICRLEVIIQAGEILARIERQGVLLTDSRSVWEPRMIAAPDLESFVSGMKVAAVSFARM